MIYLYEFIGTFFLVFTVGMTVLIPSDAGNLAPFAIGTVLASMIYAGGHVSGAHYNPAVSLAVYLRGLLTRRDLVIYWGVQLLAAIVAALIVTYFKKGVAPQTVLNLSVVPTFLAEFLFTFALCFVILNVTGKEVAGNSFYGLAIGFTVMVGAYAVGNISGAAFNPAVALGMTALNIAPWSSLLIYIVANLLGGIVASYVVGKREVVVKA